MESAFDRWLTRDPAYHGSWWEVEAKDLCDDDGGALHVSEISCDSCDKVVGWEDTGFTGFMTDESENNLCFSCYKKAGEEVG